MKLKIKECGVMDNRFKDIDNELNFKLDGKQLESFFGEIDKIALDNAFVEASQKMQYPFAPAFWEQYTHTEPEIIQSVHFSEAAKNYSAAYNPLYWNAAEQALAKEGLNYQYNPSYWAEAEKLLVAADRSVFFRKWLTIASLLLLMGFTSQLLFDKNKFEVHSEVKIAQDNSEFKQRLKPSANVISNFSNLDSGESKSEQTSVSISSSIKDNKKIEQKKTSRSTSHISVKSFNDDTESYSLDLARTEKVVDKTLGYPANKESNTTISAFHTSSTVKQKGKNNQLSVVSKMKPGKPALLPQDFNLSANNNMKEVEFIEKRKRALPKVFVTAQTGIGNSINTNVKYNVRTCANLGLTFDLKKFTSISVTLISGFAHQNLSGYLYSENAFSPRKNGHIGKISEAYQFKNMLKWQNGMMLGYQLSKRFNIKLGLAADFLVGSRIKMYEQEADVVATTDYKWGRNDFLRNVDYQLLHQLEYKLKNQLSVVATGAFGFRNQIQPSKYSQKIIPIKNRSITIGVKYRLF
ncbi:MAG: hypothetical protein AB8B72_01965 [Crocinitomicaceae bacterium]